MLCCGYTLTDCPISIRLTSLALWQSNDCPSVSKATLMNMDKCFMWIHYERLHNNNKAKHNKTVFIFLGIYCTKPLICYIYCLQSIWAQSHLSKLIVLWIENKPWMKHRRFFFIVLRIESTHGETQGLYEILCDFLHRQLGMIAIMASYSWSCFVVVNLFFCICDYIVFYLAA